MIIGPGITIGSGIKVNSDFYYSIQQGTKAPVLGTGGQNPFPGSGWISIISASGDDANTNVSLPFGWKYNNTEYTSFYAASNFYITFGSGSNAFNALAANNPALNKIFFAATDNSWQRVSSITSGTNYKRLRFEGTNNTSGTLGSPNMVYELTFFNPDLTAGQSWIELLVGQQARGTTTSGIISGLYSSSAKLTGGDLGPFPNRGVAANQSYVMVGTGSGTTWNVYNGYYVGNTDY